MDVNILIWKQNVFKEEFDKPKCDPRKEAERVNRDAPPQPLIGAVVGAYFPNWATYHDEDILNRLLDQASFLTHIFVGFNTVSYAKAADVFYLDFTDTWADLNLCFDALGLESGQCNPQGMGLKLIAR